MAISALNELVLLSCLLTLTVITVAIFDAHSRSRVLDDKWLLRNWVDTGKVVGRRIKKRKSSRGREEDSPNFACNVNKGVDFETQP
jgi:hypothetical protein